MPVTDHYLRPERVDDVEVTPRGLLAGLGTEQLRVDVVRDDVVRLAISRGGCFDETPTHAVCVDPLAGEVAVEVERADDVVRVRTAALVVSVWLDPFRIDVHRTDGSAVVEAAQDEQGRYWSYATLNDAFVVRRRCRPEDAVYGLGEKTGRFNRRGRDFTLWNTDVLSPTASGSSPTAGTRATRAPTTRAPSSTRTTCRSRSSTTSPTRTGRWPGPSSTTATAPTTTSAARTSTSCTPRAGSTSSTSSPAPPCRRSSRPTPA
ncbi:alpha-glucosidase domain-containing protein [Cellulomonas sp. ATA003]|uniref:alpha-glucosidase domain-containing protein n=1 Tax=Cellulomonas sp. ATA003 TaxID=3073064 RepID=UPI0028731784|nr:alpha-glucosidase domain-containing protein [Cellulomonas sp. ATA003]WNB87186.1 DUF4968 domain-containing protein [Cellulomonas sp. ATA003]